jgi:hypothetical protein
MLLAQSLGEYGAGNAITQVVNVVGGGVQWVQTSLHDNPGTWIAITICAVLGVWLTRRR